MIILEAFIWDAGVELNCISNTQMCCMLSISLTAGKCSLDLMHSDV